VRVDLLPPEARSRAADAWATIEHRVADHGLVCSWRWTETWLEHYGDVVPHRFALAHAGDSVVGAALVTRSVVRAKRLVPIRRLHVGTAGEEAGETVYVERNRLLVSPADRGAFSAALIARLTRDGRFDELVLDGFVADDGETLAAACERPLVERRASPTFDLAAARAQGGDVVSALRPGPRRRLRRSMREFGAVQAEWAETREQAQDILGELRRLHQARWQAAGLPGAFASARFTGFHFRLVDRLLPLGEAILFRVRSREHGTLGCLLSYREGDRVLFYQSGFASFGDNARRPGLVTHVLGMQECCDRGLSCYDFLAGDSRYKRELATDEDELLWATAAGPTRTGRLLARARRSR
jgi:CelD/BcsL family acetyltransferase involved in cellulose biosynthesis